MSGLQTLKDLFSCPLQKKFDNLFSKPVLFYTGVISYMWLLQP